MANIMKIINKKGDLDIKYKYKNNIKLNILI